MTKSMYKVLVLAVLFGGLFALGGAKEASSGVHVNIDIAAPPIIQFAAPPDVYVVPSGSSYVYMAPDYDGVYFYGGSWYRFYNDQWFKASRYNGDWGYVEPSIVPPVIIALPPEYIHSVPSGYYRIPYNDFNSNWQSWDQGRHWDSYDWYKNESSDAVRRARYNSIDSYRQQRGVHSSQQQQVQGHQQQNIQPSQHQQAQHQQAQHQQSQHQQAQHQQSQHQQSQHQQSQHQQAQHQQSQHQQAQHQQSQHQQAQHQQSQHQQPQHQQAQHQQQQGGKKHEEEK